MKTRFLEPERESPFYAGYGLGDDVTRETVDPAAIPFDGMTVKISAPRRFELLASRSHRHSRSTESPVHPAYSPLGVHGHRRISL